MAKRGPVLTRKEPKVSPRSGFVKVLISMEPDQHEALKAEALRRAAARGTLRPDASELVREAIAAWLAKRK
jgi:hypothetical protein